MPSNKEALLARRSLKSPQSVSITAVCCLQIIIFRVQSTARICSHWAYNPAPKLQVGPLRVRYRGRVRRVLFPGQYFMNTHRPGAPGVEILTGPAVGSRGLCFLEQVEGLSALLPSGCHILCIDTVFIPHLEYRDALHVLSTALRNPVYCVLTFLVCGTLSKWCSMGAQPINICINTSGPLLKTGSRPVFGACKGIGQSQHQRLRSPRLPIGGKRSCSVRVNR